MVEIIIHVGLHKTGSSYLQTLFRANYQTLIDSGILFPVVGYENTKEKGGRENTTSGHNGLIQAALGRKKHKIEFLKNLKKEIIDTGANKVFFSAENITHYINGDMSKELRSLFKDFDNVRIIFTIREPISWYESFYKELVVNGWELEYRDIFSFFKKYKNILNYSSKIKRYEKIFGVKNVETIIYSKKIFTYGIDKVFLDILGVIDLKLESVQLLTNESVSNEYMAALLLFNKKRFGGKLYREKIYGIPLSLTNQGTKGGLLKDEERMKVCDFFVKNNEYIYLKKHFYGEKEDLEFTIDKKNQFDNDKFEKIKAILSESTPISFELNWVIKALLKRLSFSSEIFIMRLYYKIKR